MTEARESSGDFASKPSKIGWRKTIVRWLPRLTAVGGAVAGIGVAGWVLIGDLKPDEAVVGTLVGLAAVALLIVAFASAEWFAAVLGRIKGIKVGSFEIQLDAFQMMADETPISQSDDEPADARNLLDLKVNLENKIAYIANNIINADESDDPAPGFVTIGSLRKGEGLLNREQAQVAYEILGMQQHDFGLLAPQDRDVFCSGARALVGSLRITVFANVVTKRLDSAGWRVERLPGESRDITIRSADSDDSTVHHIVPIIPSKKTTFAYSGAKDRLEMFSRAAGEGGRRFIVVPPPFAQMQDSSFASVEPGGELADQIWTVTLYGLLQWLGR